MKRCAKNLKGALKLLDESGKVVGQQKNPKKKEESRD